MRRVARDWEKANVGGKARDQIDPRVRRGTAIGVQGANIAIRGRSTRTPKRRNGTGTNRGLATASSAGAPPRNLTLTPESFRLPMAIRCGRRPALNGSRAVTGRLAGGQRAHTEATVDGQTATAERGRVESALAGIGATRRRKIANNVGGDGQRETAIDLEAPGVSRTTLAVSTTVTETIGVVSIASPLTLVEKSPIGNLALASHGHPRAAAGRNRADRQPAHGTSLIAAMPAGLAGRASGEMTRNRDCARRAVQAQSAARRART